MLEINFAVKVLVVLLKMRLDLKIMIPRLLETNSTIIDMNLELFVHQTLN